MNTRFFTLLTLALSCSSFAAIPLDRVAAIVVDEPILLSEVQTLYHAIQSSSGMAEAYRIAPQKLSLDAVLDRMIEEKIVKVSVKELDIKVNDSDVETQINAIAKQNNITRKTLEESLAHEGLIVDEYKRNIRGQLERRYLFDRELRRGGGITESDTRELYNKTAPVELKLSSVAIKNTPANRKIVETLIKDVKAGTKKIEDAIVEFAAENLGWTPVESLDKKFGALSNTLAGSVVGPVLINNNLQVLFVEGNRKGSPEGYEKVKAELMMQAQNQDFERRFQSWLDRKKAELNIVINK